MEFGRGRDGAELEGTESASNNGPRQCVVDGRRLEARMVEQAVATPGTAEVQRSGGRPGGGEGTLEILADQCGLTQREPQGHAGAQGFRQRECLPLRREAGHAADDEVVAQRAPRQGHEQPSGRP